MLLERRACRECGALVPLCSPCRARCRYCGVVCARRARRAQWRRASKRVQATPLGKRSHADRQRAYTARRQAKFSAQKVTPQCSEGRPTAVHAPVQDASPRTSRARAPRVEIYLYVVASSLDVDRAPLDGHAAPAVGPSARHHPQGTLTPPSRAPPAVAMLLEALSAWYRRPLYVALDAAAPAVSEFPDHWSLWLGDLSSLEIHVEWIGPVPGDRERRDPFLETMGDFKEARRLVTYAATGQR